MGEPWFPGWQNFHPSTNFQRNLKVRDLMDHHTHTWDMQTLSSLFNLQTSLQILSNPNLKPSNLELTDRIVWKHTTHGEFTTKSAYNHLHSLNAVPIPSNPNLHNVLWKNKILQPRVALFLWRLCMKNLPTSKRLSQRISTIQPTCRRCQQTEEDDNHCFLTCDIARATWFASKLNIRTDQVTETIPELIIRLFQELSHTDFAYAITTFWALWEQRNQCIFNSKTSTPYQILKKVEENMPQTTQQQGNDPSQSCTRTSTQSLTCNPDPGSFIICTDASWNLGAGGWGYSIHRSSTLIQFACGNLISPCPLHAETIAALKAVEAVKSILEESQGTTQQLHFQSDCKILVDAIHNRNTMIDWQALRTVAELRVQYSSLTDATFSHIPRANNQEAHGLAAIGAKLLEEAIGFQYPAFKPP